MQPRQAAFTIATLYRIRWEKKPHGEQLGRTKSQLARNRQTKKLKFIATMGCINPIGLGFNNLKQGLEEHVWWPFVKSLLSEPQEQCAETIGRKFAISMIVFRVLP
jgi:hypothetical protein